MKHFRFRKGDRVDFTAFGNNDTPGTIVNRIHTHERPAYKIAWDDGYTDEGITFADDEYRDEWWDDDLSPLVSAVGTQSEETP